MAENSPAGPTGSTGPAGSAAPAVPSGPSQPSGSSARLGKLTTTNMLRSLVPLVAIVLALAYFCSPQNLDPVTEIDPSDSIRYAQSLADVALPIPHLDAGWRPTSVNVTASPDGRPGPVTLTIGYLTPNSQFARYAASTDPGSVLISDLLNTAAATGEVTLGGATWEEFSTDRGERLYLRAEEDLRLLVTGSATDDELRTLAESLAA